ncbi:MAG: relaxase/mobilization nuclease domain-containing protein [Alphaproteobacteria bacterium]|nr:relaxase/mobilization nuclease domain-containing protein [Alphaproteobacteria bacterium]
MIAKRIDRKPEVRDDFAHLGRYVAAAREKGEKLDKFWIVNCDAGDKLADLDLALIEIEATRTLKPGIADKTYHLVVSFRPGEEDKLTLAQLQDIERSFAQALGYGDHQRVAGTHINTDNFHMHVAFNKIHPITGRCHTPRQDFKLLANVAREMELKYGLAIDKGMTDGTERNPVSGRARDYEAKTWEQSFERYMVENKAPILKAVLLATTWRELHDGLADHGLVIQKRGAGLVFAEADGGKGRMKASRLDRSCSLAKLEDRLGPYQAAPERQRARPPKRSYQPKPMTRHPGQNRLWKTYLQQKKPGFLGRVLHFRNWKDYLLAEAHKDALALVVILTYKELLHLLDEATSRRAGPYRQPRMIRPALKAWFDASPWKPAALPFRPFEIDDMEVRIDLDGRLLYPFRDAAGYIQAIRGVDGHGRTCDIGGTGRPGLVHVIDPGGDLTSKHGRFKGGIVVSSDCLAASVIRRQGDLPAVIAPREGALPDLVASIRKRHPDCTIVVAAVKRSPAAAKAAVLSGNDLQVVNADRMRMRLIGELVANGHAASVGSVQAGKMGAFVEDALSPEDALDSRLWRSGNDRPGVGR